MSIPRGWWLSGFNLAKELIEHPDEVVVVYTAEDFGDKGSSLDEELDSELQAHEHKLRLTIRVLDPCCSDIWRTVMENDIGLPVLQLSAE